MDQHEVVDLPLVEQIVNQVLERLAGNSAFDAETLTRLQELARSGGLAKYAQVISSLGPDLEG